MRRNLLLPLALVAAAAAGLASATVVVGSGGDASPPAAQSAPDSTPRGEPAVAARAAAPGGGETLAVATYRNANGQVCAALGVLDGDAIAGPSGERFPFAHAGNCSLRPEPVAVQVEAQGDDDETARDESGVVIWGLAAPGIERVRATLGASTASSATGRDGAFVIAIAGASGAPALTLERADGNEQGVALPGVPDLDEISAGARRFDRSR